MKLRLLLALILLFALSFTVSADSITSDTISSNGVESIEQKNDEEDEDEDEDDEDEDEDEDEDDEDDEDNEDVEAMDEDDINDMLEDGDVEVELEDLILEVEFDDEDDWENYEENTRFVIVDEDDEVYIAEVEADEDNFIIWGQNTEDFEDGVIEVITEQDGGEVNNAYGVICRADPDTFNFDGYHFWISGDGFAAIVISEDNEIDFVVEWTQIDEINQGDAVNLLHVVCVGEYLALYVNGELAVEGEDDTFDEGSTGLVVLNLEEEGFVRILFDDLRIWEADD